MSSDNFPKLDVSITDFDMFLPGVLERLAELKIPFRIYSAVLEKTSEMSELDAANALEAIMHAAVWGAENPDWVLAIKERQGLQDDLDDEYEFGPMQ